jgi:fibro-slime domain-containing protein
VSSRIRFAASTVFALVLGPFALACSAGGGENDDVIPPGSGDAPTGGAPGLGTGPVLAPPVASNGPGPDLGAMTEEDDAECDNVLEVTYRDFNENHPDFEMPFSGDVVRLTLVQPNLGADGKPEFRSSIGCHWDQQNKTRCNNNTVTQPVITSKESFDQWYRTVQGVNEQFDKTMTLDEPAPNNYVFDSTNFFPLEPTEGFGITPTNNNPGGRNFLFTTEIHVSFTYSAGQRFTFRGDDDLWIFVNGKLALDLGSMHGPEQGTIDFDAQASFLNITPGRAYPMDIFQAERHTSGSNFRFETNIQCFVPQIVR